MSPLVAALIFAATNSLVQPSDIVGRLEMVPLAYIPALFFTVVFGLPVFLLFVRFKLIRWWSTVGAGFAIGVLVGFIIGPSSPQLPYMLFMGAVGAATSLVFWLIWRLGSDQLVAGDRRPT